LEISWNWGLLVKSFACNKNTTGLGHSKTYSGNQLSDENTLPADYSGTKCFNTTPPARELADGERMSQAFAINQPAVYRHHAGCAAIAITKE
jgi:hypothetical protein